jgi:hypothetical protein
MLDTRVDESAFEAELHPKLTSGRLTREDLACGRSSGLVLRRPPITTCDIAAPPAPSECHPALWTISTILELPPTPVSFSSDCQGGI